jgi:hypothetical protein
MIRLMKWTRRGVLEYAALYGEVEAMDANGNTMSKSARLCEELRAEGLLRSIGWYRYVITDEGRDWLAGV